MTSPPNSLEPDYSAAAQLLADTDALLIGAGAGMGVDSGLPTFRGDQGFWTAYPAYRGCSLADVACPNTFTRDPELAWGFYGHRLNLYRQHPPHAGFAILRCWAEMMPHGYFVLTSNVDGHWLQAPAQGSLRRAFAVWLRDVLLPARLPGVRIDAVLELNEVQNMLAERVIEWTEQWKQQGLEEGRKEGEFLMLQELLTQKFGPLDAATLARLSATDSETLLIWGKRVLTAKSLAEVFGDYSRQGPSG